MYRANGKRLYPDSVFVIPPNTEFVLATEASHLWLTVHIPTTVLFSRINGAACEECSYALNPGSQLTSRLEALVKNFMRSARINPAVLREPASCCELEDAIVRTASATLGLDAMPETTGIP